MKSYYNVQFPGDGSVESQLRALSQQAHEEFTKRIYLKLQKDPGHTSDGYVIVDDPMDIGVYYVWGENCAARFTVDPIQSLVKVLSVMELPRS